MLHHSSYMIKKKAGLSAGFFSSLIYSYPSAQFISVALFIPDLSFPRHPAEDVAPHKRHIFLWGIDTRSAEAAPEFYIFSGDDHLPCPLKTEECAGFAGAGFNIFIRVFDTLKL